MPAHEGEGVACPACGSCWPFRRFAEEGCPTCGRDRRTLQELADRQRGTA